jgi:hypothetical protein
MQLHTADGARKYLTSGERDAFLREAERAERQVRTLCMTLAYAGCRLSEALALTADRVDLAAGVLVIESLKKRRAGIYRAVPVPPALLDALDLVHGIREHQARRGKGRGVRLWPWSRMTGWRAVHAVNRAAKQTRCRSWSGCHSTGPARRRRGSAWRFAAARGQRARDSRRSTERSPPSPSAGVCSASTKRCEVAWPSARPRIRERILRRSRHGAYPRLRRSVILSRVISAGSRAACISAIGTVADSVEKARS